MIVNLNNAPNSGPLTAEELDRYRNLHRVTLPGVDIDAAHRGRETPRKTLTHCAGPCQQGRRLCPCPEACEAPAEDRNAKPLHAYIAEWLAVPPGIVIALALVGGIVAAVGLAHFALT
jgi:hypothetical protein